MLSLNEEIKRYSNDSLQDYQAEISDSNLSVVAEAIGTIIEEDEQIQKKQKPEETPVYNTEHAAKTGKKRMLFGLWA